VSEVVRGELLDDATLRRVEDVLREACGVTLVHGVRRALDSALVRAAASRGMPVDGFLRRLLLRDSVAVETFIEYAVIGETYFFRHPEHLRELARASVAREAQGPLLIWSAGCASGEEPYSIAMTLAAGLGEKPWEIVASDISTRVLERARSGHYAMARAKTIPREYLAAHCLKGTGPQEGTFLIEEKLRNRIQFMQVNLNEALPSVGEFDAIFLRNVMIYFDAATKREVVARLVRHLRPGGYLFIGHSESLNGVSEEVKSEAVALYRKVSP
jgi:chemotaxis protein methyltransferase CheR